MKAILSEKFLIDGKLGPAAVIFEEGHIKSIHKGLPKNFSGTVEDMGELVVMAGLVDTHVHVNEPGRTDWEGFETATMAAAAGGITTMVDMPLNCIPVTTTKKALEEKLQALENKLWVDCGFWGGVIPQNISDLPDLLQAGVLGVKSFLIDSGIKEFPEVGLETLNLAMPILSEFSLPYLIHAELDQGEVPNPKITQDYKSFEATRPHEWEVNAIERMIELSKKHKTQVHIVHLSSAKALEIIKKAKDEKVSITVETCPHYLTLATESIPDGDTLYKCCPPIRDQKNQELLWEAVQNDLIDFIVSDHSPCTPKLKLREQKDLENAWGGISSLQYSLPLIWSSFRERNIPLEKLAEKLCQKPAEFAGLKHKGEIKVGHDADFVVWDPHEKTTITEGENLHRHKATPYMNRTLYGRVHKTFLRGRKVFDHGKFPPNASGTPLLRKV